jgi:hypothetical protein
LIQQKGQWQPRQPRKQVTAKLQQANSVYDLPSIEQAIKWMHAVCGYPVKSTWIKAIKAGNFIGWPLLTEKNVNKYYPESLSRVQQNTTRPHEPSPQECTFIKKQPHLSVPSTRQEREGCIHENVQCARDNFL